MDAFVGDVDDCLALALDTVVGLFKIDFILSNKFKLSRSISRNRSFFIYSFFKFLRFKYNL